MLTPISDYGELLLMVTLNVVIALGNENQISELREVYNFTGIKPRVHIQIDSGLGRYGFNVSDLPDFNLYKDFLSIEGCFSHLAGSNNNYKKSVDSQVHLFNLALEKIRESGIDTGLCHISNSKAAMTFGALGFDAVRVGSAILGKVLVDCGLEEAVWLESKVFSVYNRQEGEHIGYNGETFLRRDSSLAVVRVGTGCGVGLIQRGAWDFSFLNVMKNIFKRINEDPVFSVWINGKQSPVLGRIGVSHMTVDVTENAVKEGDIVKVQVNPLLVHPYVKRQVI
jgi:alanine racemase